MGWSKRLKDKVLVKCDICGKREMVGVEEEDSGWNYGIVRSNESMMQLKMNYALCESCNSLENFEKLVEDKEISLDKDRIKEEYRVDWTLGNGRNRKEYV